MKPRWGSVTWKTWEQLLLDHGDDPRNRETGMPDAMESADRLAGQAFPGAPDEEWWSEPVWNGTWWPDVEFAMSGSTCVMVRTRNRVEHGGAAR